MKLLIDIPEHIYEHAKETTEDSRDEFDAMRAIANGTQPESSSEIPNTCGDAISRKSIKQKLQEQHDFFVTAYGGFSNLPQNDKSRVDEITNCIAMVVNEPSITPQQRTGRWIEKDGYDGDVYYDCSVCGESWASIEGTPKTNGMKYCPNCGAKMEVEE